MAKYKNTSQMKVRGSGIFNGLKNTLGFPTIKLEAEDIAIMDIWLPPTTITKKPNEIKDYYDYIIQTKQGITVRNFNITGCKIIKDIVSGILKEKETDQDIVNSIIEISFIKTDPKAVVDMCIYRYIKFNDKKGDIFGLIDKQKMSSNYKLNNGDDVDVKVTMFETNAEVIELTDDDKTIAEWRDSALQHVNNGTNYIIESKQYDETVIKSYGPCKNYYDLIFSIILDCNIQKFKELYTDSFYELGGLVREDDSTRRTEFQYTKIYVYIKFNAEKTNCSIYKKETTGDLILIKPSDTIFTDIISNDRYKIDVKKLTIRSPLIPYDDYMERERRTREEETAALNAATAAKLKADDKEWNELSDANKKHEIYLTELAIKAEENKYLNDHLRYGENKGGKKKGKAVVVKKIILGRERCIYKIPGSKKEHVKYKGTLVTVADYKNIMKSKAKAKAKDKAKPKPKAKAKAKAKP
jgi:hypothetical protein